jgi:hypothetical protein
MGLPSLLLLRLVAGVGGKDDQKRRRDENCETLATAYKSRFVAQD